MIHRLQRGRVPDKPHTAFEPDGALAYEHCLTREGFAGAYTILYHRNPPHWVVSEEDLGPHPGSAEARWDGALRRRHLETGKTPAGGEPFLGRKLLLASPDLGVWVARPDREDSSLVANADADELVFVHEGSGRIETPLGVLRFAPQDYVYIPKALPHRWRPEGAAFLVILEGRTWIDVPRQFRNEAGQLRMDAPYTHRDFVAPDWPEGGPERLDPPRRLIVQRHGSLTALEMAHNPFDVVGWDGQVWPFVF